MECSKADEIRKEGYKHIILEYEISHGRMKKRNFQWKFPQGNGTRAWKSQASRSHAFHYKLAYASSLFKSESVESIVSLGMCVRERVHVCTCVFLMERTVSHLALFSQVYPSNWYNNNKITTIIKCFTYITITLSTTLQGQHYLHFSDEEMNVKGV